MVINWFLVSLVYIILTYLVAELQGKKRRIGYRRSLVWSLIFSPAIGYLVTVSSPKI